MHDHGDENGKIETPLDPTIHIVWDDANKGVSVACDRRVFPNLEFAIAVLGMAKSALETKLRQQTAMKGIQQMQEHQVNQAIAKKVMTR